ncbi:MAG: response regulator, partial [Chitinophagales bacterium]
KEAKEVLSQKTFDAIISDYNLGDGTVLDILELNLNYPFVVVTGAGDEEIAVAALKKGAYDYIIKDVELNYTKVLPITLQNAISAHEASNQLNLFKSVIINANDAIVIGVPVNSGQVSITYVNNAFTKLFGYTRAEITDKNYSYLIGEKTNKQTIKRMLTQAQQLEPIHGELILYGKGNRTCWVDFTIVPIFNKQNRLTHFVSVQRDISKRKEAEEQLLRAKNLEKQFLDTMSHEIRTPLNAIVGMSNLLLDTPALNEEQMEYASSIKQAGDNLVHLINNMLDLSKMEAGKISLETKPFSISNTIQQVVNTIKYKVDLTKVQLLSEIDEKLPKFVSGDAIRLNQILLNLMGNATKFTERGTVKIAVFLISEDAESNYINIGFQVSDSGIGIAQSRLNMIFDRFTQAENDTSSKFGGTGLGLSIVKQLVELQNGKIEVASTLGKGTSFTIKIPFEKTDQNIQIHTSNPLANKNLNYMRLLLVEDNIINQKVAIKILRKWRADVHIANNGKECVELLRGNHFDLILLDLQMPVMDGYDTVRYVREELEMNEIPVIALTASAYEDKKYLFEIGFNDYLTKPFNTDQLYDTILKFVDINLGSDSDMLASLGIEQKPTLPNKTYEVIDLSFIKELSDNNLTFVREMVEIFIMQTEEIIKDLPQLQQSRDWQSIHRLIHKFKSSVRNMGSPLMHQLCSNLETLTQSTPNWNDIAASSDMLMIRCKQALQELHEEMTILNEA